VLGVFGWVFQFITKTLLAFYYNCSAATYVELLLPRYVAIREMLMTEG
jgi:hypothetical protein